MKLFSKRLMIVGYWLVVFIGILVFWTYQHEQTHKQISLIHGATACRVSFNWKGGLTTCYWENSTLNTANKLQANMLNGVNEIVSYNLQVLLVLLVIIACWFSDLQITDYHSQTYSKALNKPENAKPQENGLAYQQQSP